MKLLVALITYNRLKYTQRTLRNFRRTISDDTEYYLVAVDNASHDGTQLYLKNQERGGVINKVILNPENYYPGRATNIGWEAGIKAYPEATHLMRLDNDMELKKGWDVAFADYFKFIPELGQLGYDHEAIEHPQADSMRKEINGRVINEWPGCVGGPCVIRRKVWDDGHRYDESAWTNHGDENTIAAQEDVKLSRQLKEAGWLVGHTQEDWGRTFATKENWLKDYPDYYRETMAKRGYKGEYSFLWQDEQA
jgi:glycosyltransferase involved in cell wall biosynthesis